MKPRILLTGLILSALTASLLVPVRADSEADRKVQQELRSRVMPQAEKDPAKALAEYQQFVGAHPDFTPGFAIYLYIDMARIHNTYLKDTPAALADLDAGLAKYPNIPNRFLLVASKGDILNREGRPAEAEALFQEQWPQMKGAGAGWLSFVLPPYAASLKLQHKDVQASALWRGVVQDNMISLGGMGGLLLEGLIQSLLQNNQEDEALSWSKLYFQVVPFQEGSINKATQLLVKAWTTKNLTSAVGQAFAKSLQDPTVPNPLAQVPDPPFDSKLLQEQFALLNKGQVEQKVTLLIVAGRLREAMLLARRQIVDHPESADGSLQAARVFKAADLNLIRANALLEFIKTGTGENPMIKFLEQQDDAPTLGAPKATP